jgi:hypothetical protein
MCTASMFKVVWMHSLFSNCAAHLVLGSVRWFLSFTVLSVSCLLSCVAILFVISLCHLSGFTFYHVIYVCNVIWLYLLNIFACVYDFLSTHTVKGLAGACRTEVQTFLLVCALRENCYN